MATLILVRPSDSTIVAHTVANESGQYLLMTQSTGTFRLQVHMVGYRTENRLVTIPPSQSQDFTLREDMREIEAVRVEARKRGTKVEGKTVKYNINAYLTGSEKTLGDLLKTLPGLKVAEDGTVTAQGQDVSKILFNGRDLFGGNVALATKNVDAAIADSVRVVHGYSEYSLYGGFENKDETVIDVGVKQGMMDRLNGKLEAGGGYRALYSTKGNAMYIGKENMLSLMASGNNTGERSFTFTDLLTFMGGIEKGRGFRQVPEELWTVLRPPRDTYKLETGMAAINYNHHRSNRLKAKLGLLTTWGNTRTESQNLYEVLLGPDLGAVTEAFSESGSAVRGLYGVGSLSYNPHERLLMGLSLSGSGTQSSSWARDRDFFSGQAPLTQRWETSRPYDLSASAFTTVKLGEHLLEGNASYGYGLEAPNLHYEAEQIFLPFDLDPEEGIFHFDLPLRNAQHEANARLGTKLRINPEQYFEITLNHDWDHLEYESDVRAIGEVRARAGYDLPLRNDADLQLHRTSLTASWHKHEGFIQTQLGVSGHMLHHDFDQLGERETGTRFYLAPTLRLRLEFGPQHQLTLRGTVTPRVRAREDFLNGYRFQSYKSAVYTGDYRQMLTLSPNAQLRYRYFSSERNLRISSRASYHYQTYDMHNQQRDGLLSLSAPFTSGNGHEGQFNFNISKTLRAFWELGLYMNYSIKEDERMYATERLTHQGQSYGLYPSIRTTYLFPLNMELGGNMSQTLDRTGGHAWGTYSTWKAYGELILNLPPVRAVLQANYSSSIAERANPFNQFNLGGDIEWAIWGGLSLVVEGKNLLNLRTREWQNVKYGQLYRTEQMYRTLPGYLVAKARWEFGNQPERGRKGRGGRHGRRRG